MQLLKVGIYVSFIWLSYKFEVFKHKTISRTLAVTPCLHVYKLESELYNASFIYFSEKYFKNLKINSSTRTIYFWCKVIIHVLWLVLLFVYEIDFCKGKCKAITFYEPRDRGGTYFATAQNKYLIHYFLIKCRIFVF